MWENEWFYYVRIIDIDMEYDSCKFDLFWKFLLIFFDCLMKFEII